MSTSPELLFDQLKKLYDFDASTYNLPWAEILNDYQISGANRPSKAKAWHTTLLVHILGQYKKNHTECAERVDYLKRHETFLKLYAKYTNPEASLDVDSKIFEL